LIEWDILPNINAKVSPAVKAQDLAIRALLEEKLYFYHVCGVSLLSSHDFPFVFGVLHGEYVLILA